MSTSYKAQILEFADSLHIDIKSSNQVHNLKESFNESFLDKHKSGEHDIYVLQSLFGLVLINYVENESYSFSYIDFAESFTHNVDYSQLFHLSKIHKHNYFELLFVLDGQLDIFIEGVHYRYNRGDACLINLNIRHEESYSGNFTVVYFLISKEYLNTFLKEEVPNATGNLYSFFQKNLNNSEGHKSNFIDFSPIVVPIQVVTTGMEEIIYLIIKEMVNSSAGYQSIVRGLVHRFFHQLQLPTLYGHSYVELESVSGNNLFEETLRYINEKKGKVTRQEIAEVLHYNGNYINQIFKKHTNQSISEYSRNVCLREATSLLLNSKLSIATIIKHLGFENRTSFYTQFKKRYGVTPLEYREGLYNEIATHNNL
ncbi:helix-turn-helix domain-containing protein [Robertmurraya sp. P23]|uniref:helix-turn-helix domain-containing protein n=1 Tax=Robertmurraya sp. P23 TaxID=3436931 RepID=UPI003D98E63E